MSHTKMPAQILRDARSFIPSPAQWTRGTKARDARGTPVEPTDATARRWCAIGAMDKAAADDNAFWIGPAWRILESAMGSTLADFNDTHRHADVLAAFDRAIAAAEAQP